MCKHSKSQIQTIFIDTEKVQFEILKTHSAPIVKLTVVCYLVFICWNPIQVLLVDLLFKHLYNSIWSWIWCCFNKTCCIYLRSNFDSLHDQLNGWRNSLTKLIEQSKTLRNQLFSTSIMQVTLQNAKTVLYHWNC